MGAASRPAKRPRARPFHSHGAAWAARSLASGRSGFSEQGVPRSDRGCRSARSRVGGSPPRRLVAQKASRARSVGGLAAGTYVPSTPRASHTSRRTRYRSVPSWRLRMSADGLRDLSSCAEPPCSATRGRGPNARRSLGARGTRRPRGRRSVRGAVSRERSGLGARSRTPRSPLDRLWFLEAVRETGAADPTPDRCGGGV